MAGYKYLILEDSEGYYTKRFKAITYKPSKRRTDSVEWTLGGKIDKAAGTIINTFEYTLRVPYDETDPDYGSYDDLIYFYELTDPNGTPNDVITLTDHYGIIHYVMFIGGMELSPLTTQLEGPNAWYIVPITLVELPASVGSGSGS